MNITHEQMLAELRRELAMRQRVYPSWVQQGKITQVAADHRIAVMASLIELVEAQISKQIELFPVN
jgi:hypothetical protein